MPILHRLSDASISYNDRVNRHPQETLDESRRGTVGRHEIGERAEHGTFTKTLAFAQKPSSGWCQSHSLTLEAFLGVNPRVELGALLDGARKVGARSSFHLTRSSRRAASAFENVIGYGDYTTGHLDRFIGADDFA
jgi:hypothetical protein